MELKKLTALQLGAKIKSKEVSVNEALDSVFDSIKSTDNDLNAYITVCEEKARAEAPAVQKGIDDGCLTSPLAGVPISVKDNICTSGIKTTCGSKILHNFVPPYDATAVVNLKKAGMIIPGKLNMDEFAMGSTSETSYFGAVKNPRNTDCVPGGSSGGSAASVGGFEAFCSLGSDTGGSIRQPAAYCGVTGFKPTYGRVSRYGLIAYASSLDQIGPICRDAADCAAIMDVIAGYDSKDSTSLKLPNLNYLASLTGDIRGKVIGVPEECFDDAVDEDVRARVSEMTQVLASLGAEIRHISLPFMKYVVPTYYILATAEASSNLSRFDGVKYGYRAENCTSVDELFINSRSEGFGTEVKSRIMLGTFVLSSGYYDAYYNKALKMKQMIVDEFAKIFASCDAIVCPTSPDTAPKIGSSLSDNMKMYLSDIFTVSANLAGLPGLSVPCGFDKKGMPVGAQIMGAQNSDTTVLNIGHAYQGVTDFHKQTAGGAQ